MRWKVGTRVVGKSGGLLKTERKEKKIRYSTGETMASTRHGKTLGWNGNQPRRPLPGLGDELATS